MSNSREPAKGRTRKQPEPDAFLTVLHAPDRESLSRLLQSEKLDLGPIRMRPDAKGIEVHLYAKEEEIRKLKKLGWKLEVGENLSAIGRERQKEVGKGDRFEGGRIPPRGLGKKAKKGD